MGTTWIVEPSKRGSIVRVQSWSGSQSVSVNFVKFVKFVQGFYVSISHLLQCRHQGESQAVVVMATTAKDVMFQVKLS